MKKTVIAAALGALLLPLLLAAGAQAQEEERIARIEIIGNKRIPTDTILTYITLEPGDQFDAQMFRDDFQALWNTGFFTNIRISRSAEPGGLVVTVSVTERPLVRNVVYRGLEAVGQGDIEEAMDEQGISISRGSLLSEASVAEVMAIIRDQFVEKGLEFGQVDFELEPVGQIEVDLVFHVVEGGRVKIKEVRFVGNEHFSQWELMRQLQKSRPTWVLSWVIKDNIYSSRLLEQDLQEVQNFYAQNGFLRATIREPIVELVEVNPLFGGAHQQAVITVPISEGPQYRVNSISFEGNEKMDAAFLRAIFQLKEGQIYDKVKIDESVREISEFYYSRGMIDAFLEDRISYIPDKPSYVDLIIDIREGDIYIVRRINFEGNRVTRDKVMRRNVYLNEQQPFNFHAFQDSLRRLQQLGFFGNVEPEFHPSRENKTVDLTFKVTETGRNQIQFGGGYSGLEGAFFNFAFSTSNFWGQGQTLSFALQAGGRNENYEVSFFDPWLFDRPIGAGVTFFSRNFEFQDFVRRGIGGRASLSLRLMRWLSLFMEYRYELVEIRNPEDFAFSGSIFFPEGRLATGSIKPTLLHNTVDHPMLPTRGHRSSFSVEFAADYLGSDIGFVKLIGEQISHFPLTQHNVLRFRAQVGWAKVLDEGEELPVYERFFMGGEYTIRGFELRTIGPRDEYERVIGGTSSLLFNFEYMFLVTNELRIVPYIDAGNAYSEGIDIEDMLLSAGVEIRFFVPVMNVPFRFIYARPINPKEYHRTNPFTFTIGVNF